MLLVGQMISIILITVDRVVAVKFCLQYRAIVTKKRLLILLAFCWAVCISHGFIVWYFPFEVLNKILATWEILVTVVIVAGYGYIIAIVQQRNRNLVEDNNHKIRRPNLKLTVPALIVLTFFFFCLIPDLLLAIGVKFSLWILSSFYFNFTTDSLIYIFGSGRIRNCIKSTTRAKRDRNASARVSSVV